MREANPVSSGGARPTKRARRIALDDHQFGCSAAPVVAQRRRDILGIGQRVEPAGAAEARCRLAAEPVVGKVEAGMLPSLIEVEWLVAPRHLKDDRSELDGFGPGSDHETDTNRLQLSPWLRRGGGCPMRSRSARDVMG